MPGYKYKKIDAFTSKKSLGNPAACIYLNENESLSEKEMLAVARQHKGFVSEMVYCSDSSLADIKITYYSSECEVDFCGHGTIACLYDLAKTEPRFKAKKEIRIETNKKGIIFAYNEIENEDTIFITAPDALNISTNLSATEVADILNLPQNSILQKYPIDLINAGLSTLIVPISNLHDEINAFPDEKRLKDFCISNLIDIVLVYSLEVADEMNIAHTRVFAPKFGYLEDPATGSGNSSFGYYMLKNNIWRGNNISIEQGGAELIFNKIKLKMKKDKVLFGGSATVRIKGQFFL